MSYLFYKQLALNIGLGDSIYGLFGNTVHGLNVFVGVSYVFNR